MHLFSDVCQNTRKFGLIKLTIFIILSHQIAAATDYCSLCEGHVACRYYGDYGETCPEDRAFVEFDDFQKEYIVRLHNRMRNKIALGEVKKFNTAAKMSALQWDDELAYLAELNVRSCVYTKDECRATSKYRNAGQNIARRGISASYYEPTMHAVSTMIMDWFLEYRNADMSYINSFHHHPKGKYIGDFTVMVNDRNKVVGCAMMRYAEDDYKYRHFVCNYGYTNIVGNQVYESGSPASRCNERHGTYEGLCAANSTSNRSYANPSKMYIQVIF